MWDDIDLEIPVKKAGSRSKWDRTRSPGGRNWKNSDFQCAFCHNFVLAEAIISGVQNRNHCPYCLWSKHLDLHQSGDRMAICKAGMRPVALTLKQAHKKYYRPNQGELMIVHHCQGCGRISINRIAADDDCERILAVLDASAKLDDQFRRVLEMQEIIPLSEVQRWVVHARLYGSAEPVFNGEVHAACCG